MLQIITQCSGGDGVDTIGRDRSEGVDHADFTKGSNTSRNVYCKCCCVIGMSGSVF